MDIAEFETILKVGEHIGVDSPSSGKGRMSKDAIQLPSLLRDRVEVTGGDNGGS